MALGDDSLVATVYEEVASWKPVRTVELIGQGLDPMHGALALRLGKADEAQEWYRTGLNWAERRDNHQEAVRLLDRAAALFQEHGAQLYLRQVLAKKDILAA